MKHQSASGNPAAIGSSVRRRVEVFLQGKLDLLRNDFPVRIEKFASAVALWGARMNLTAHPEDPGEIAFHVIDSLMPILLSSDDAGPLRVRFANGCEILDLGAGAGFPGLVLAAASSARFTLVESRRKRSSFLQYAVAEMQLDNVEVLIKRAEEIDTSHRFNLVIGRAFGDPRQFFELAQHVLKPDGLVMLYANPSQPLPNDLIRIPYRVPRADTEVGRILAIKKST